MYKAIPKQMIPNSISSIDTSYHINIEKSIGTCLDCGNLKKDKRSIRCRSCASRLRQKGVIPSEETKRKMSIAHEGGTAGSFKKGITPWNKGIPASEEAKRHQSEAHKGHYPTEETRKKLSEALRNRKRVPMSEAQKEKYRKIMKGNIGEKARNWQGGKTSLSLIIRHSQTYKEWRLAVFTRDNFQCVIGGKEHESKLHADHIVPFSFLLFKNNIKSIEDALNCEELWDVNNGRTLCIPCHMNTDTWLSGALKYKKHYEKTN